MKVNELLESTQQLTVKALKPLLLARLGKKLYDVTSSMTPNIGYGIIRIDILNDEISKRQAKEIVEKSIHDGGFKNLLKKLTVDIKSIPQDIGTESVWVVDVSFEKHSTITVKDSQVFKKIKNVIVDDIFGGNFTVNNVIINQKLIKMSYNAGYLPSFKMMFRGIADVSVDINNDIVTIIPPRQLSLDEVNELKQIIATHKSVNEAKASTSKLQPEHSYRVSLSDDECKELRKAKNAGKFPHTFTIDASDNVTFKTSTPNKLAADLEKVIDAGETSWAEILNIDNIVEATVLPSKVQTNTYNAISSTLSRLARLAYK